MVVEVEERASARTASRPAESRAIANAVRTTVAIVLAGGRGARLKQLTDWRAKPAVAFGGKFRIIDFTLSNCINSDIKRVNVCTQYKAHSLIRHVQKGWGFLDARFDEFVEVMPAQQRINGDWYQGTADAVFQNIDILKRQDPQYVLVLGKQPVRFDEQGYSGILMPAGPGSIAVVGAGSVNLDAVAAPLARSAAVRACPSSRNQRGRIP